MTFEEKVDLIVDMEFKAFDKVSNEGGRADCQDDYDTFYIMRKSQYLTWTDDMLEEYIWYFDDCTKKGRNLITEKYGRMMETTHPWEYKKIADSFPVLSKERVAIQESIIAIQVKWMEEFALEYPKMATNARAIHTSEDRLFRTSYETYLRGELSTYSDELIAMYGQYVADHARDGLNLARIIMTNTAKLYGYSTLESAEANISSDN